MKHKNMRILPFCSNYLRVDDCELDTEKNEDNKKGYLSIKTPTHYTCMPAY